jgi:hypothetical protein
MFLESPSDVRQLLNENVAVIKFTKADGSERELRGTRNLGSVPDDKQPKGTGRKLSDEIITVFDLDINEWRSFDFNRLNSFEVVS